MKTSTVDYTAYILVIIGGLNWGLVGAFGYNLIDAVFGAGSVIASVVYVLFGLAALYTAVALFTKSGK